MNNYRTLEVFIGDRKAGTLAAARNHLAAFEYDRDWLAEGYSLNPLSLPLEKGVFCRKSMIPLRDCSAYFPTVFRTDGDGCCWIG